MIINRNNSCCLLYMYTVIRKILRMIRNLLFIHYTNLQRSDLLLLLVRRTNDSKRNTIGVDVLERVWVVRTVLLTCS